MQSSGKDGGSQRPVPSSDYFPPDLPEVPDGKKSAEQMDRSDLVTETEVKLDESAQSLIGYHLKAVYSEIVEQPIPDEFLKLLEDLERKEQER